MRALFRCDHLPFLQKEIPAVWLFGGSTPATTAARRHRRSHRFRQDGAHRPPHRRRSASAGVDDRATAFSLSGTRAHDAMTAPEVPPSRVLLTMPAPNRRERHRAPPRSAMSPACRRLRLPRRCSRRSARSRPAELFETDTSGYTQYGRAYLSLQSAVSDDRFINGYVRAAAAFGVEYTPVINGTPSLFQGGGRLPGERLDGQSARRGIPVTDSRTQSSCAGAHSRVPSACSPATCSAGSSTTVARSPTWPRSTAADAPRVSRARPRSDHRSQEPARRAGAGTPTAGRGGESCGSA